MIYDKVNRCITNDEGKTFYLTQLQFELIELMKDNKLHSFDTINLALYKHEFVSKANITTVIHRLVYKTDLHFKNIRNFGYILLDKLKEK